MSLNATLPPDYINTTLDNTNVSHSRYGIFSNTSDVLNCVNVIISLFSIVIGSIVVSVVRTLNDDQLRSGFSLLGVLVSDILMAASNCAEVFSVLNLIDRQRFKHWSCYFNYTNWILTILFTTSLAMSLLCLVIDQIIAVFRPLYFRTSDVIRRKIVYGFMIGIPMPVISVVIVYKSLEVLENPPLVRVCNNLVVAIEDVGLIVIPAVLVTAITIPCLYAVVLLKISLHTRNQAEIRIESNKNKKLVMTFFMLSASYLLLWIPTLVYFGFCFLSGFKCWGLDTIDVSLIMHMIFSLNYLMDPILCAVRMEPVRERILLLFGSSKCPPICW